MPSEASAPGMHLDLEVRILDKLEAERVRQGLTLTEWARRSGMFQQQLHRYVSGETRLTIYSLTKMCSGLGYHPVLELVPNESEAPSYEPKVQSARRTATRKPKERKPARGAEDGGEPSTVEGDDRRVRPNSPKAKPRGSVQSRQDAKLQSGHKEERATLDEGSVRRAIDEYLEARPLA